MAARGEHARPRRRSPVAAGTRLLAVVLAAAAVVLGPGPRAHAGGNDVVDIQVQCVWDNGDGSTTAVWSYVNHSADPVDVPVGPDNRMTTTPEDRGQPTHFLPGQHLSAWVVTFTGSSLAWHLLGSGDTANNGSKRCAANPVPLVGGWPAAALGLAILLPGGWLLLRRRRLLALFGQPALPWRVTR